MEHTPCEHNQPTNAHTQQQHSCAPGEDRAPNHNQELTAAATSGADNAGVAAAEEHEGEGGTHGAEPLGAAPMAVEDSADGLARGEGAAVGASPPQTAGDSDDAMEVETAADPPASDSPQEEQSSDEEESAEQEPAGAEAEPAASASAADVPPSAATGPPAPAQVKVEQDKAETSCAEPAPPAAADDDELTATEEPVAVKEEPGAEPQAAVKDEPGKPDVVAEASDDTYPKERLIEKITEAAQQGVLPWEQSFFLIKNMPEKVRPATGFKAGMTFLEKPKRERTGSKDIFKPIGGADAWLNVPPACPLLRRRVGRIEPASAAPASASPDADANATPAESASTGSLESGPPAEAASAEASATPVKIGADMVDKKPLVYVEYTGLAPGGKDEDVTSGALFQVIDEAWLGPHGAGLGANELGFFEVHTSAYSTSERYQTSTTPIDGYCLGPAEPPPYLDSWRVADGHQSGSAMGNPRSPRSAGKLGPLGPPTDRKTRKYMLPEKQQVALIHGVHQHGDDWMGFRKIQTDSRYPFGRLTCVNLEDAWRALKAHAGDEFKELQSRCLAEIERTNAFGPIDYLQLHAAQVQFHARRVAEARAKAEHVEREESRNRSLRAANKKDSSNTRESSYTETMSSCAMCRRPSTDRDQLCGPYRLTNSKDGNNNPHDKRHMCHRSCLLWCPQVKTRPTNGQMRHVMGAIRGALRQICMICGNKGANTRCAHEGCRAALHLSCANESPHCALDTDKRILFCINHSRGKPANQLLLQDVGGDDDIDLNASDEVSSSSAEQQAAQQAAQEAAAASKEERIQQAVYDVMHNGLSKTVAAKRQSISVKLLSRHLEIQKEHLAKQKAVDENAQAPEPKTIPGGVSGVTDAPIYRPTEKEFTDPMAYIDSIRPHAEQYGICKIVPPPSWSAVLKLKPNLSFGARSQKLYGVPPQGIAPGFPSLVRQFTPDTWREFSRSKSAKLLGEKDPRAMKGQDIKDQDVIQHATDNVAVTEAAFWNLIEQGEEVAQTEVVTSPTKGKSKGGSPSKTSPKKGAAGASPDEANAASPSSGAGAGAPSAVQVENVEGEDVSAAEDGETTSPTSPTTVNAKAASANLTATEEGKVNTKVTALGAKWAASAAADMARRTGVSAPASSLCSGSVEKDPFQSPEDASGTTTEKATTAAATATEAVSPTPTKASPRSGPSKAVTETFYSTDISASGMNKTMCDWNLAKFVQLPNNVLKFLRQKIPGVTSPMMYFGMVYSQFCWHAEDNDLYSISYLHSGCPKTWYGLPSSEAAKFEEHFREQAKRQTAKNPDLQYLKSIMWPTPDWLVNHGLKVTRAVQEAGHFVVTFPRAYHAGFSHGANVGEAVNFATPDWLPYGRNVMVRYRESKLKISIIPHEQLLFDLAGSITAAAKLRPGETVGGSLPPAPLSRRAVASDSVLSGARTELWTLREQYERLFLQAEADGVPLTMPGTATADGETRELVQQGIYCEMCSQSCYVAAVVIRGAGKGTQDATSDKSPAKPPATSSAPSTGADRNRFSCLYCAQDLREKVRAEHDQSEASATEDANVDQPAGTATPLEAEEKTADATKVSGAAKTGEESGNDPAQLEATSTDGFEEAEDESKAETASQVKDEDKSEDMDVDQCETKPATSSEGTDVFKNKIIPEARAEQVSVPENESTGNAYTSTTGDEKYEKDREDKVQTTSALSAYCVVWKALEDIDDSIALIDGHFASGGLCSGAGGASGSGLREEKRCSICLKGGVLVGPYCDESFYVHEHCLLFSQQAVADVNGFIDSSDVSKALRKGVQTRCAKCRGFGATVDCCALVTTRGSGGKTLPCRISYHYECANADPRVALNRMTYECYCSAHSRQRPSYELKPIAVPPGEYLDIDTTDNQAVDKRGASKGSGSGGRLSSIAMSSRVSAAKVGVSTEDVEEDDRSNSISMMSPRLLGGSARRGSLAGLSARRSASRAAAAENAKSKRMVGKVYVPPKRMLSRKPKRQRRTPGGTGGAAVPLRGSKRPRGVAANEATAGKSGKRAARGGARHPANGSAASVVGEIKSNGNEVPLVEEDGNVVDAEMSQLRQESRRALGLRETKTAQKKGSSDTSVTQATGKPGGTAKSGGAVPSKGALRRRKPAGSKKKATVYPGETRKELNEQAGGNGKGSGKGGAGSKKKGGGTGKELVLVKFFDTGDYSWIPRNKVCAYRSGSTAPDAGKGKKHAAASDPSYARAIRLAQEYLSSLS